MNQLVKFLVSFLIGGLLLSSWLGCNEPSEARKYRIAKSRSDLGSIGVGAQPATTSETKPPTPSRMFVAIADRDDATWFFKLTGRTDAVDQAQEEWEQILASVDFAEDGKPKWEHPESWKVGPEKSFRFATLLRSIEDVGNIELSISNLAANQDLLANVNRWRDQLQNPRLTASELKLGSSDYQSGQFKTFDDTGFLSISRTMSPNSAPRGFLDRASGVPDSKPNSEFDFDLPDGWKTGKSSSIVRVRLLRDEDSAQITVTPLVASANKWLPNVKRWAEQVTMDASDEFIEQETTELTVSDIAGQRIRLVPSDESKTDGLIGIMLVRDGLAWFFKLSGKRDEVEALEADFDQFVKSFKFN